MKDFRTSHIGLKAVLSTECINVHKTRSSGDQLSYSRGTTSVVPNINEMAMHNNERMHLTESCQRQQKTIREYYQAITDGQRL